MRSERELDPGVSLGALTTNLIQGVKTERQDKLTLVLRSDMPDFRLEQTGVHSGNADGIIRILLCQADLLPYGICCDTLLHCGTTNGKAVNSPGQEAVQGGALN